MGSIASGSSVINPCSRLGAGEDRAIMPAGPGGVVILGTLVAGALAIFAT